MIWLESETKECESHTSTFTLAKRQREDVGFFGDEDFILLSSTLVKKKKTNVVPFEQKVLASMQATRELIKDDDDDKDELFGLFMSDHCMCRLLSWYSIDVHNNPRMKSALLREQLDLQLLLHLNDRRMKKKRRWWVYPINQRSSKEPFSNCCKC
uniref:Uncharacterized protein n=2 Tax=Ditylenchus dipsaci TaxID=166011 RepID=A0A915EK91_9BILA